MKTYPLIRRKPSLKNVLGIISGKILYQMGKNPSRTLSIPKVVVPETVIFSSLLPEHTKPATISMNRMSGDQLKKFLQKAGLSGRGGGAFPVYKKIEALQQAKAENRVFIINGVECDPGLLHDGWILEHHAEEISMIVELLRDIIPFEKVILAVKPTHASVRIEGAETVVVKDTYPAGAEGLLIKELLGTDIPSGAYPADKGFLVQNVQTLLAMYHALGSPEGAKIRYLTLVNMKTSEAAVVQAIEGMEVSDIVAAVYPEAGDIYIGGGIMQARPTEEGERLTGGVNCIIVGGPPQFKEKDCAKCYQCNIHCPAGLDIQAISAAVRDGAAESLPETVDPDSCIQCGSCTYVCPAGIDPCSDCRELMRG